MNDNNITISAVISHAENCGCSCCGRMGRVTKLSIPFIPYAKPSLTRLPAELHTYWVCNKCRDEIILALVNAKTEEEGSEIEDDEE